MAKIYETVNWENGTLIEAPYVEIDGVRHEVNMPKYEGNTPMTASNLKHMDDAIKELYDEGTTSKDIVIGDETEATEDTKILVEPKDSNSVYDTMKYKYNGQLNQLYLQASDTLPIGTIIDYAGDNVPDGWELVDDTGTYKKIKKIATSIGVLGKILNSKSDSTENTYSCDYINKSAMKGEPSGVPTFANGGYKVELNEKMKIGDGFSIENGGIKVTSDKITKVNISAQAHFSSGASTATGLGLQVYKNTELVLNVATRGGQDWISVFLPTTLLDVAKDDILYLYAGNSGTTDGFTLYTNFSSTNLCVEEFK